MSEIYFKIIRTNLPYLALAAKSGNKYAWRAFVETTRCEPDQVIKQCTVDENRQLTDFEKDYLNRSSWREKYVG